MVDIASGIKKDTAEKLESIIVEYGKISKTLLKESGVHEGLMQTARNFASNETSIANTNDILKQMKNLTQELEAHVNAIDTSIKGLPKLNQLLQDTTNTAKGIENIAKPNVN